VVPLILTSQRPSSGRPSSSVRAKKATPSPEPTGSSPVRAIVARAYGSMSRVPDFGNAVHAPIATAPNAVPRVSASQVVPRPTRAAIARANNDPRSRRTIDPVEEDDDREGKPLASLFDERSRDHALRSARNRWWPRRTLRRYHAARQAVRTPSRLAGRAP